ncbi:hypothetical protein Q5L94_10705 [Idiomarina sp. Sol25]|uniref:hypothetical protein n=1 Tax=Idiomarina sp. Sol25 TaxID=3064000 RepID=UPI00294B461D|nr:hypothetical protein [Idiomarina sp. Sol25]MDV6328535.1 hypothetical protein [Idiomarina sp. Sol25]
MSFKFQEISFAELSENMAALLNGEITALLVKRVMSPKLCQVVYDNFINSAGLYQRNDGVPALMVGANTYLQDVDRVIDELQRNGTYTDLLFRGANNIYRQVFDSIEEAGYRFRQAYIQGLPAPVYRGSIWNNPTNYETPLLAHTDWPQVKYSGLEFQNVKIPIAINFYPKHPPKGFSALRLYNFVPEESWLDELGIMNSGGYPIAQEQLDGVHYIDIQPEEGDILLFNAAHVHAVNNRSEKLTHLHKNEHHRLNINGFFGFCDQLNRVLAWA